jgi:carboxyl-terminal processing protease
LILDLRGNPGGLLDQAVGVSDLFLDEGVVVTQRARSGQEVQYRSTEGEIAENIPLIVLLDGGSASASEVVAGALRDRERAILIGQTSFGKGSVQHVHDLYDGSQLHVTVALWFTPNETPIQDRGLDPDIEVQLSESDVSTDADPYIEAALDYIDEQGSQNGDKTQSRFNKS